MKECSMCRERKPLADFPRKAAAKDGRMSYCKPCNRDYCRTRHSVNRDDVLARQRIYRDSPTVRVGATELRFRARIADLGGTIIEPAWINTDTPHRVRCAEGHDVAVRPARVLAGQGMCRVCAGMLWDSFYVVRSADVVKFGITSGDPRVRLAVHAGDGLTEVVRVFADMPTAADLEKLVLAALADAGELPVRGREYFRADVLALVLDVVDSNASGL